MAIRVFLRPVTASGRRPLSIVPIRRARGEITPGVLKGLAIAAGVLVIAAVIYFNTAGASPAGASQERRFKCSECGHEFTMTGAQVGEVQYAAQDFRKRIMPCPKCGKDTGMAMSQCSKCAKWYTPKEGADACPHCGYDLYKAHGESE